jgi:hypothetical protein
MDAKKFAKTLKREMIESKYQALNTQRAKEYNSFVDWWVKEIDRILTSKEVEELNFCSDKNNKLVHCERCHENCKEE